MALYRGWEGRRHAAEAHDWLASGMPCGKLCGLLLGGSVWRDAVRESERVNEIANNNNNKAPTTTTSSLCTLSHTQKPTATASGSSSPYCMNALLPDLFARPPPLAGL